MWEIENKTPYQAEQGFVRDQEGGEVWIVVVKGTWDILSDGSLQLAKDQVPVFSTAQDTRQEDGSHLLYDADIVLTKPLIDVILNGKVYDAPATKEFVCSLEVTSCSNSKMKKRIGQGAIPMDCPPRINYAGTYDQNWQKTRQPLLPLDFDLRFFQSAPEEQQISRPLSRNTKVSLSKITPSGNLEFSLPRVHLGFLTNLAGKEVYHHPSLHSIILEPEYPRVILVWHTALPCQNQEQFLEKTQILEKSFVSLRKLFNPLI